jgi:TrmH family RNA methyltransferase
VSLLVTEQGLLDPEIAQLVRKSGTEPVVLPEAVFNSISDTETPQGIAAEIAIPAAKESSKGSCVFLEGIQDAGNVGAIIRSAAAFGIASVVLDSACADPWSPKVLRAGMGGHFLLGIAVSKDLPAEFGRFSGKVVCTVARGGADIVETDLSGRLGWVFGSEGRGVSAAALKEADLKISIPVARGTESLNVAASAAICFFAAFEPAQ